MSPQAVYFLHKLVHEDVRGTLNYYVPWPDHPLPGTPTGATAKCKDGTYSKSQHHSGTCSSHGGVAEWLKAQ